MTKVENDYFCGLFSQWKDGLLTLNVGESVYTYANRLDPGQPLSNLAAGLRSNLFSQTQITIKHNLNEGIQQQKTFKIYF